MKLIIDIPDISYKWVRTIMNREGVVLFDEIYEAVNNGIPLEDITNDIEQTVIREQTEDSKWALGLRYSLKIIDKYIDSEKKTGHWIDVGDSWNAMYECSKCGYVADSLMSHCPHCGIEIKGDKQ